MSLRHEECTPSELERYLREAERDYAALEREYVALENDHSALEDYIEELNLVVERLIVRIFPDVAGNVEQILRLKMQYVNEAAAIIKQKGKV